MRILSIAIMAALSLAGISNAQEREGFDPSRIVDRLFDQVKNMENSPQRAQLITEMIDIARFDAPWVWGFIPKQFSLHHDWYLNSKPNLMANNSLKYRRIEPQKRLVMQARWNKPVLWPVIALVLLVVLVVLPAFFAFRRQQRMTALGTLR